VLIQDRSLVLVKLYKVKVQVLDAVLLQQVLVSDHVAQGKSLGQCVRVFVENSCGS